MNSLFFIFACCFSHLHQLVILKLLEHFLEGDSKHGCMNMWSYAPNITVNTIQLNLAISISIAVASDSVRVRGVSPAIDPPSSYFFKHVEPFFGADQEYYNITSWYWQGSFKCLIRLRQAKTHTKEISCCCLSNFFVQQCDDDIE